MSCRNVGGTACLVDFDDTVTFEVSVTLENCATARRVRYFDYCTAL